MASWKNEDEMLELFRRYAALRQELAHCQDAQEREEKARRCDVLRDELVEGNLGLVYSVVRRLAPHLPHVQMEDLIQYGIIGLIRAVDGFDPARGVSFSKYAGKWIEKEIFKGAGGWLGIPRSVRERCRKVLETQYHLMEDFSESGRAPTIEEIAAVLGMTSEEVDEVLDILVLFDPSSIDELEESGVEPASPEEAWDGLDPDVWEALRGLSRREQEIIWLRYWENRTFAKIARRLGLRENNVKQIHHRAMKRLRKFLGEEGGMCDATA